MELLEWLDFIFLILEYIKWTCFIKTSFFLFKHVKQAT
jgi:hypothetical protein